MRVILSNLSKEFSGPCFEWDAKESVIIVLCCFALCSTRCEYRIPNQHIKSGEKKFVKIRHYGEIPMVLSGNQHMRNFWRRKMYTLKEFSCITMVPVKMLLAEEYFK